MAILFGGGGGAAGFSFIMIVVDGRFVCCPVRLITRKLQRIGCSFVIPLTVPSRPN